MTLMLHPESSVDVTPVGSVVVRGIARVRGRIHYVETSPADLPAQLVVRLVDDSGGLDCIFMGRRTIAGIEPGAMLQVEGRIGRGADVPVMYNPRYELLAA